MSMAKAMTKKLGGAGNTFTIGISLYYGGTGYANSRDEGRGVVGSAAQGLSDAFLVNVLGFPLYVGGGLAMAAPKLAVGAYDTLSQKMRSMERGSMAPFASNTFVDSQQAYTMRQAGMQMAENSSMNTKKALMGNEAQYLHR